MVGRHGALGRAAGALLGMFLASAVGAGDLRLEGCPLGDFGLPAGFAYVPQGRTRSAVAAVVLPASFEEVRGLVDDVAGYPAWVLLDGNGAPLLKDMVFDPRTGRGSIGVGESGDERIEGLLSRKTGPASLELRLEMLGGESVKEAVVEVAVSPYETCPGTARVVMRVTWKVGWLAHLLANEALLSTPALLVVVLRDDLVAHVLRERDDLNEALLGGAPDISIRATEAGLTSELSRVSLIRFRPGAVRVDAESMAELQKVRAKAQEGGTVKPAPFVRACIRALSTQERITGYQSTFAVEGVESPARLLLLGKPGDLGYSFSLGDQAFFIRCFPVVTSP